MEHFKDFACESDQPLEQAAQRCVESLSLGKSKSSLDTALCHVLWFDLVWAGRSDQMTHCGPSQPNSTQPIQWPSDSMKGVGVDVLVTLHNVSVGRCLLSLQIFSLLWKQKGVHSNPSLAFWGLSQQFCTNEVPAQVDWLQGSNTVSTAVSVQWHLPLNPFPVWRQQECPHVLCSHLLCGHGSVRAIPSMLLTVKFNCD